MAAGASRKQKRDLEGVQTVEGARSEGMFQVHPSEVLSFPHARLHVLDTLGALREAKTPLDLDDEVLLRSATQSGDELERVWKQVMPGMTNTAAQQFIDAIKARERSYPPWAGHVLAVAVGSQLKYMSDNEVNLARKRWFLVRVCRDFNHKFLKKLEYIAKLSFAEQCFVLLKYGMTSTAVQALLPVLKKELVAASLSPGEIRQRLELCLLAIVSPNQLLVRPANPETSAPVDDVQTPAGPPDERRSTPVPETTPRGRPRRADAELWATALGEDGATLEQRAAALSTLARRYQRAAAANRNIA